MPFSTGTFCRNSLAKLCNEMGNKLSCATSKRLRRVYKSTSLLDLRPAVLKLLPTSDRSLFDLRSNMQIRNHVKL